MTSKVYRGLSEVLGLRDESMVLSVFVRKIITNLKYWSHREPIVVKTLLLLNELCVGYSSVRKLVKLEEVQFILQNHTVMPNEQFYFETTELLNQSLILSVRFRHQIILLIQRVLKPKESGSVVSCPSSFEFMFEIYKINSNSDLFNPFPIKPNSDYRIAHVMKDGNVV